MSQQNPWSIKGIKAGNREAAKELAGKHGVTIGELINNLIEEAEGGSQFGERVKNAAAPYNAPFGSHQNSQYGNPENSNFGGNFGANDGQNSNNAANIDMRNTTPDWNDNPMNNQNPQFAEASRLAQAMETLNRNLANFGAANQQPRANIEAANFNAPFGTSPQTDNFTQKAVETLLSRVEDNERRTDKTLSQLNLSLSDIKQAQDTVADRLRRIEQSDPTDRALLALRNLESSLARMANQLADTESKTISLERKFDAEKSNRLTPTDVERILSQNTSQFFSKFDAKIGEIDMRLGGVEQLASSSIEQTDKGISLLSERIKDTEAHAQNTNESLREALVELSARLTAVEAGPSLEAANQDLQAYAAKFSELEARINSIDDNIGDLIEQTNSATNARFTELAASIGDRLLVSETETLKAIENVSGQLVNTVHNLDDRLKAIESLNSGTRDNATAMKLELGRITHAVNEQLEQLQNREADFLDNAGKHINKLAEQVTSRLDKLENNSSDIIDKVGAEVKSFADTILRRQTEAGEEFTRKLKEADERLNQKIDEKIGNLSRDMLAIEDRTKTAAEPLLRNFDHILDRMDKLEAQNPNSAIVQMPAPEFNYEKPHNLPETKPSLVDEAVFGENNYSDFSSKLEAHDDGFENIGRFGSENDEALPLDEIASFPENNVQLSGRETTNDFSSEFGKDFDDLANQSEFEPDFIKEEIDDEPLAGEFIDFEIVPPSDENKDPWLEQIEDSNSPPIEKADYLSRARRAAIEAAEYKEEDKRSKKERKPIKKPAMAKKAPLGDILYDENGAQIDPAKAKGSKKSALSPVAIAAASALVLSSAAIGYKYYNNSKQVNQNELPASLKDAQIAAPTATEPHNPAANAIAPMPAHPAEHPAAPTPAINTGETQSVHGAAQKPASAAPAFTAASPKTIPSAQTPSQTTNKNQFIGVNPAQGNLRPNATKPVAAPTSPQNSSKAAAPNAPMPKIASANAAPSVSGVSPRQSYEQAMQKLQAGDTASAIVLLTRASDGGDTKATNRLARMYERGEGVTRDLSKARRLTERAASAGSREAQHNLGVYYVDEGPGRDLTKAAENFRRAAKRGLADSQYNLAAMAEQGNGIPKNEREAYFWYSVAGRNGDADASKKASELAARLAPAQKLEEDRRISSFRTETGGPE